MRGRWASSYCADGGDLACFSCGPAYACVCASNHWMRLTFHCCHWSSWNCWSWWACGVSASSSPLGVGRYSFPAGGLHDCVGSAVWT